MKTDIHRALALAVSCAVLAPAVALAANAPMCINVHDVDRTEVKDAKTILYHMRDGKTWRNTFKTSCPQLANGDKVYTEVFHTTDQICANSHQLKVRLTGDYCTLGEFSPAN